MSGEDDDFSRWVKSYRPVNASNAELRACWAAALASDAWHRMHASETYPMNHTGYATDVIPNLKNADPQEPPVSAKGSVQYGDTPAGAASLDDKSREPEELARWWVANKEGKPLWNAECDAIILARALLAQSATRETNEQFAAREAKNITNSADAQYFRWLLKHHSGSGPAMAGVGKRCWIGGVEFHGDDVRDAIDRAINASTDSTGTSK